MNKIVKLTLRHNQKPVYVSLQQVLYFNEFNKGTTIIRFNNKENNIIVTETPGEVMEVFTKIEAK